MASHFSNVLIFSRLEFFFCTRDEFIKFFCRLLNGRESLLIATIYFNLPGLSVILVKLEPFIIGRSFFVIYLSLVYKLLLKFLVGILQVEAHVIVEELHFLFSIFGILEAPELKLAHVAHDIGVAILFFHGMIKFDTFAIGLRIEDREYRRPVVLHYGEG